MKKTRIKIKKIYDDEDCELLTFRVNCLNYRSYLSHLDSTTGST